MYRKLWNALVPIIVLTISLANAQPAQAERGAPGSAEFGFGAVIYPSGPYLAEALELAGDLKLDWLSVPVSWAFVQPSKDAAYQLDGLDQVMKFAMLHDISVMLSITDAPEWAQTAQGPDAEQAAAFITHLMKQYPFRIQAIELFPGANTRLAWGAQPSASAYYSLFSMVSRQLTREKGKVLLIAAGLEVQADPAPSGNIDDLVFLDSLYHLGAASLMPVISVQFPEIVASPASLPEDGEPRMLRHYEDIRRVMVANQHQTGLIWITRFSLPSGKIAVQDPSQKNINAQVSWATNAYAQIRSQLYIGVGFLQSINPEREGTGTSFPALLQAAGEQHPFVPVLREMVSLNQAGSSTVVPGKAKGGSFGKKRP